MAEETNKQTNKPLDRQTHKQNETKLYLHGRRQQTDLRPVHTKCGAWRSGVSAVIEQ